MVEGGFDSPAAILAQGFQAPVQESFDADVNPSHELTRRMVPDLVRGIGQTRGDRKELSDYKEIIPMLMAAQRSLVDAVNEGFRNPGAVVNKSAPQVGSLLSRMLTANPQTQFFNQWAAQTSQMLSAAIGKDISLTSPLTSGFVPFDLVAPAKLIYPMFSPLRNRIPRVRGQGTSRRAKLITGFPGTQTGGSGYATRITIPEFPGGGTFANWPLQLPGSQTETAADLNVPYKFMGLTEPISWLAEFAGQGFQDISALANLLLLQKTMTSEEYQLIGGNSTAFSVPAAPTLNARAANTANGEVPLSGVTTNVYVQVTGANYYGETAYAAGSVAGVAVSAGQVVDVYINPVAGPLQYNIYVGTGASNPGRTALYQYKNANNQSSGGFGAHAVTLQGALPTTTANAPAADSGTSSANDYDGIISILSGHASGTYSVGAGYYNASAYSTATLSLLNAALNSMWTATKARPTEIILEGTDLSNLSNDIRANAQNQSFRLFVSQSELSNVLAGAAVASIVNPITRDEINLQVHPWLPQGNAILMSYSIPFPYSETNNIWEVVLPQDYMSIAWPVIDVTYRYSMFLYGALVNYAPIYCGLIQGIQHTGASLQVNNGFPATTISTPFA